MNIIRPSIDDNKQCITSDNVIIYNCVLQDNGNIKGITEDNIKALYVFDENKWYFGKDIGYKNLISLSDRSVEDRQRLGSIGGKKAKENRDKKKNINELAKAMLEQVASDKVIRETIDNPEMMIDNSYASLLVASMIQSALNGSFKAFEAVRDTAGYKPKNELEIQADIMTDNDKALIDKALKTG
jgi:hypothetical protein